MLLIFVIVFWLNDNEKTQEQNYSEMAQPNFNIPLEYLSAEELQTLGVDPTIKAQVINRDPLVYKIIKSDEDIIKDRREVEVQKRD